MRPRLALAAAGFAVALWLVPASVHIVNWGSSGPVRVALLAPLSRLWWIAAATALVWIGGAWIWVRSGRSMGTLEGRTAPLLLLWSWIVPFLPWLPDRAPGLLALAGPIRWAIAAAAVAATVFRWFAAAQPDAVGRAPQPARPASASRAIVFAAAFAMYTFFGLTFARDVGFGGDEPHYLVIAHSLLVDRDLAIENNHARGDYHAFFGGTLGPDYLRRGRDGQIYSIHAPGLPAVLVPAYAAAGATGAVVMIAALAALTALAIFDAAALLGGERTAVFVCAAACATVPFVPQAWLIYPELPAALIVAWAVLWWLRPAQSSARAAIHGFALGALPWLHTKFVVLVPVLAGFYLYRLRPRTKSMAALTVAIAASVGAWLFSFYLIYGVFDPQAPYGSTPQLNVLAGNIPRSVLGLLFDQKFGLLLFSPVYLAAIPGFLNLLRDRERRMLGAALALAVAVFVGGTARFYMWWGGSSAPARFLVPIVPLIAPMLTFAVAPMVSSMNRRIATALLAASLGVAATAALSPEQGIFYSHPHGFSRLLLALQGPAPLDRLWPTFTEENWTTPLLALARWIAAFAAALTLTVWTVRWHIVASALAAIAMTAFIGGAIGALLTRTPDADARAEIAARGKLALLYDVDPAHLRAVDATNSARLTHEQALAAATVTIRRRADGPIGDAAAAYGPFELPEGRYDVTAWFGGTRSPARTAVVTLGPGVEAGRAFEGPDHLASIPIDVNVSGPIWVGASDAGGAGAIERIDIVPRDVVPRARRLPLAARGVEPIGDASSGYLAYVDGHTFPEGGVFWTKGTHRGQVVVVPKTAAMLRLVLHVGPNAGPVAIQAGEQRLNVDMNADETREVAIPLAPGTRRLRISVEASRAFTPAAVDPKSDDRRALGCQVRPLLQ